MLLPVHVPELQLVAERWLLLSFESFPFLTRMRPLQ